MDKNNLKRENFKRNFLKEIILRLDVKGVFQSEMETIVLKAKKYLKEHEFTEYDENVMNEILRTDGSIQEVQSQIVYTFSSNVHEYVVSLSTSCIILSVRSASYKSFDEYSSIFIDLCKIYNDTIDFFTTKRLGIRKINTCLFKEKKDVNIYLSDRYYDSSEKENGFSYVYKEKKEAFKIDNRNLNLIYVMGTGISEGMPLIQTSFDSDIFITDSEEINDVLFISNKVSSLNDSLFSVYLDILTDSFASVLTSDMDIPDCILGVEENGI